MYEQPLEYGKAGIFLIVGFAFVYLLFLVSKLIAPKHPTAEKLTSYECGEEPTGSSWFQVNSRFYVIALIFLLFDVELVFIFPWSVIFADKQLITAFPQWGWLTFIEMVVFVSILLLGLVYLWVKGDLEWIRPEPVRPSVTTAIPISAYKMINDETHVVKTFGTREKKMIADSAVPPAAAPVSKPAFKPVFRRPAP